ncbi:MAG: putative quinol monooxygenase [Pyrinomonadaceae bacterium]
MIGILFRAKAKPGKLQNLIDFLIWDGKLCRDQEQPGTLRFEFYPDQKDETALYVYEAYRDESAFEERMKNPPFQAWSSGLKDNLCTTSDLINGEAIWSPTD